MKEAKVNSVRFGVVLHPHAAEPPELPFEDHVLGVEEGLLPCLASGDQGRGAAILSVGLRPSDGRETGMSVG